MKPIFFPTTTEMRKWFEKNHEKEKELFVGYYKVATGKLSVTWSQSVDVALCFGWIDGIRRSIDEESYLIRFTPRRPTSVWSAVNIKKMEELIKLGLMTPAGLAIFEKRKEHKSKIYSYENKPAELSSKFAKELKVNKKALAFFKSQTASYQRTAISWVMSAKQEATRKNRLEILIRDCEGGKKIKQLNYGKK